MTSPYASPSSAILPGYLRRATSDCEQPVTDRPTTLALRNLVAGLGLGVALMLAGCGGKHVDTYQAATDQQTRCCEHLAGAPRDQCLGEIVAVEDPTVATSSANQRTYGCIQRHFQCDATTGRATPESNQRQLDCIQDLGE